MERIYANPWTKCCRRRSRVLDDCSEPNELRVVPPNESGRDCRLSRYRGRTRGDDGLGASLERFRCAAGDHVCLLPHCAVLCPCSRAVRLRLSPLLAVARARLLPSSSRGTAALAPLPAGKGCHARSREGKCTLAPGKPLFRDGPGSDPRRSRSVHGGSLSGCRDLYERHRAAYGVVGGATG